MLLTRLRYQDRGQRPRRRSALRVALAVGAEQHAPDRTTRSGAVRACGPGRCERAVRDGASVSSALDELEELPDLALLEPGQLAPEPLEDRRRRDDVLRAGVHVAEVALDVTRTQAGRAGRRVDEARHLLRRARHVHRAEPDERVLLQRDGVAAVERVGDVAPRLEDE